jgi:hypothetical protein
MSLEQRIEALTAAIEANTAALLGGAGKADKAPAATAEKAAKTEKVEKAAKTEKAAYEAKHTKTEALAAIDEVKVKKGVPAAKAIIKAVGFDKLAEIVKPEDLDKLYEESKKALEDAEEEDM